MEQQGNNDFEIGDVENFSSAEQQFSHSALVMKAMSKVLENGSKEPMHGFFETKTDRNGNVLSVYHPDSRKEFIASVQVLLALMSCDFDEEATDNIKAIETESDTFEKKLVEDLDKEWDSYGRVDKENLMRSNKSHTRGFLDWDNYSFQFIQFNYKQHRKIFAELSKLTKRLDFFKAETFEN